MKDTKGGVLGLVLIVVLIGVVLGAGASYLFFRPQMVSEVRIPEEGVGGSSQEETLVQMNVEDTIRNWPGKPKEMVQKLVSKYGDPDEVTSTHIVWLNNSPWKKTVVYREEVPHNFPTPHTDFLEQTVGYRLPMEMLEEVTTFNGSISFNRTKGEVTVLGNSEEANIAALNLADDVATQRRTSQDAQKAYENALKSLENGKETSLTKELQFKSSGNKAVPERVRILQKLLNR